MSVHVHFKLKDPSKAESMNEKQSSMFGEIITFFISEESNQEWLDDINNNEDSPQRHLKPAGKKMTMEALKKQFRHYTEVGKGELDIGFFRTSESDMCKMLEFINDNKSEFSYVDGIHELVERSKSGDQFSHLLYLDNTFPGATYELPEDHPKYRDVFDSSCTAYIEGMNGKEIGVLYGNVETPVYMRARTTIDPTDSPLIKDKKGRNIILIPLLPLGESAGKLAIKSIEHIYKMGIREDQYSLIAKIYPNIKPADIGDFSIDSAREVFKHCAHSMKILSAGTSFNVRTLLMEIDRGNRPQIKHIFNRAERETKGQPSPQAWWFAASAYLIRRLSEDYEPSLVSMYDDIVSAA